MARRLDYANEALDDIGAMQRWLGQPGAGLAAARRAQAVIEGLREAPCRYRQGDTFGTRRLVVRGYVVIYEVDPDTADNQTAGHVWVLRVFGPGQQRDL